jgi:hypothetical protein
MGLLGLTIFIVNYIKKTRFGTLFLQTRLSASKHPLFTCTFLFFVITRFESFIGAPTIGICLGIAFSAITVYGGATERYKEVLAFEPDLFFYVLLPTIIIDASLNVNAHLLLLNFGTILVSGRVTDVFVCVCMCTCTCVCIIMCGCGLGIRPVILLQ